MQNIKLLQYIICLFLLSCLWACQSTSDVQVKFFKNWQDNIVTANNHKLTYKFANDNYSLEETYYFQEIRKQLQAKNFVEDKQNPRFIIKAEFTVNKDLSDNFRPIYVAGHWWPSLAFYYGKGVDTSLSYDRYNVEEGMRYYVIYTHALKISIVENGAQVFEAIASLEYKNNQINDTYKFLVDTIFKTFPGENAVIYVYKAYFKTGDIKVKSKKHF